MKTRKVKKFIKSKKLSDFILEAMECSDKIDRNRFGACSGDWYYHSDINARDNPSCSFEGIFCAYHLDEDNISIGPENTDCPYAFYALRHIMIGDLVRAVETWYQSAHKWLDGSNLRNNSNLSRNAHRYLNWDCWFMYDCAKKEFQERADILAALGY